LADHLRNLLVIRTCGPDSDLVEVPGVSMDELAAQAEKFDPVALTQDIAILEELRRQLRGTGAARALLDATLVRLALADQFASIEQLLNGDSPAQAAPALSTLKKKVGSPAAVAGVVDAGPRSATPATESDDDDSLPQPGRVWEDKGGPSLSELLKQQAATEDPKTSAPIAEPQPVANVIAVDPKDLAAVMARLRDAIHRDAPGIDGFLSHGKLVAIESGQAVLRYSSNHENTVQMLSRNGKKELIQKELSELLNEPVGLRFEIEPASETEPAAPAPHARPAARREAAPQPTMPAAAPSIRITPELKELLRADPLIATIIDELGGEIVKVE